MYLQLSGVMWLSVKRECIANNTRNEGLVSKCLNCSCTMHVVPLPTKWCLTLPVFFSLQSFVLHAHRKPTGGSLPRHIPFSDSAYPHCVSDPLPQSFVGSSYNWTALNHDSERSSRVPYSEQAMLAHLGLSQTKSYLFTNHRQVSMAFLIATSSRHESGQPPHSATTHSFPLFRVRSATPASDHCSTGQLSIPRGLLKYCEVSGLRQLILVLN